MATSFATDTEISSSDQSPGKLPKPYQSLQPAFKYHNDEETDAHAILMEGVLNNSDTALDTTEELFYSFQSRKEEENNDSDSDSVSVVSDSFESSTSSVNASAKTASAAEKSEKINEMPVRTDVEKHLASTSTPAPLVFSKVKKIMAIPFGDLDVTAIPSEKSNLEITIQNGQVSDSESPEKSSEPSSSKDAEDDEENDVEDIVTKGLANMTCNAAATKDGITRKKHFPFQRKERNARTPEVVDLGDSGSSNDDSDQLSANFDFHEDEVQIDSDSVSSSSSGPAQTAHGSDTGSRKDRSTDIDDLSLRIEKIVLAKKPTTSRKAILLDQPPRIGVHGNAYNPTKIRDETFFGDVRRTVTKLAETIETMPTPAEDYSDYEVPSLEVQLFNHQIYGLQWLSWREREFPGGGILADEMGLGKTLMIISLILKSKMEASFRHGAESWMDADEIGSCIPSRSTLVVCPLSCLMQWENEINSKAGHGRLNIVVFHGPTRTTSAPRLAQADVVLTTYQTIASEIPKDSDGRKKSSPLKRIYWHRIVLDEAHQIRNPKTVSALAICQLVSRHRWAVTGTPVHNRPEDFYSMVKFLRMVPFDDAKVWDFWIGMKQVRKSADARERLHTLGKALILRRTKDELQATNADVRQIPPKTIETVMLELNEKEREVYDHLMQFSKSLFQNFLQNKEQREAELQAAAMAYTAGRRKNKNEQTPEVNFTHLFALIVRLRQCAVHPYLIQNMLEDEEEDSDLDDSNLLEEITTSITSKRNPVFQPGYISSKIQRILDDLEELREKTMTPDGSMEKVVIVSSWVKLLQVLHEHLRARKFSTVFITGQDNVSDRTENMRRFNENPRHPQIALLSLQAGAVGINLIGGNHVFFVEPHWNPQIELQAQDRVHRFGQKKDVKIKRYISASTIEDRILELQEQKLELASGLLANTKKSASGGLNIAQMRHLFEL